MNRELLCCRASGSGLQEIASLGTRKAGDSQAIGTAVEICRKRRWRDNAQGLKFLEADKILRLLC